MTFRNAVLTCFAKYFTFSGRASRAEYWWFALFCLLGGLIASAAETFINGVTGTPDGPLLLSTAFNLATLIPSLSAGFRRMHDTGRSGLFLFYPIIAVTGLSIFFSLSGTGLALMSEDPSAVFVGGYGVIVAVALVIVALSPFFVLWWLTRPSEPGQNRYGPNPHEVLT